LGYPLTKGLWQNLEGKIMDQINLMKLGQLTILDNKIEGLRIKIERARNEILLYLSIGIDIEELKVAYMLQASQELHDTVVEYMTLLNQREKMKIEET